MQARTDSRGRRAAHLPLTVRRAVGLGLGAWTLIVAGGVSADEAPAAAPAAPALEEVVVTAQRRQQNLQEVPVSVTTISGEDIDKLALQGATDYLAMTPNVSFTEDGQSGSRGLGIAIRGVNNLVSGENAFVNSVGIYLDGFSVASVPNQVANPFLPDMQRVEVLRGPQGTYFGRNSLGGALNLTTNDPIDTVEGALRMGTENYANAGAAYNVTGILNLPVSDRFALRGVAFYENSSGLVENINPTGTDDSGHDWLMTRLKGKWEPTDNTTVRFTLMHSDEQQGHDENVPSGVLDLDTVASLGISEAIDPGTGFWPQNRNLLSHDLDERNDLRSTLFTANIEHQLSPALALKVVGGVIDASQERVFDNDLIGGVDALKRTNRYDGRSWSTEARLEFRGNRIDWVAGALYARDVQTQQNNVAVSSDPTASIDGISFLPPFPTGLGLALNDKRFAVRSLAAFGDLTWHLSDRWDLFAGGRYTRDTVHNRIASFGTQPGPDATDPAVDPVGFFGSFVNVARPVASAKTSFDDVSPRIGLRFAPTDNLSLHTTVSRGYKAGGASVGNNTNAEGQPAFATPFGDESLWNYEIGLRSELFDRRLRVNASAFYLDWSDLQLEAFRFLTPGDLSSNFEQTINVASARAKGAELEVLALATPNLTLGGTLGLLDTEITSDTQAEITGGFVVDLQGRPLPKAPELTWSAFGEYRWPRAKRDYWVRVDLIHRDGQYSDVEGLTVAQTTGPSPNTGLVRALPFGEFPFRSPDYDVVNLRAGVDGDRLSFNFYVENLADEEYYTGTQENFGASGIRLRPHPRVFGASAQWRF